MLSCSRSQLERGLQNSIADCISTQNDDPDTAGHLPASEPAGLSDGIGLSDASGRDIERIISINKRMKDFKLNFYAVCGRGGQPSYRIIRPSCVEEANIGYLSPSEVSERLKKQIGLSLDTILTTPITKLRKLVSESKKEIAAKAKEQPTLRKKPNTKKASPPVTAPIATPAKTPAKAPVTPDCETCEEEKQEAPRTKVPSKPRKKTDEKKTEEKLDQFLEVLKSGRKKQ